MHAPLACIAALLPVLSSWQQPNWPACGAEEVRPLRPRRRLPAATAPGSYASTCRPDCHSGLLRGAGPAFPLPWPEQL